MEGLKHQPLKCTAKTRRNKGAKEPTTCPLCFAAGTPIHTDHGDVPVEKIEEGDEVLSRSRATGKLEYQRVTALTPKHQDSLLDIRVEGEAATLRPSSSHPFWVKRGDDSDGAWIAAGKMRVGDLVQTIQGDWRRVVAITPEKDAQTVYNFTVDINHDYFVGDTGFLVHNAGGCGCNSRKTFFKAFPNLIGQVVVHHAIPQAVLGNYPGLFSPSEIQDLGNLRGIPNSLNSDLHLSKINRVWNKFYRENPNPTRDEIERQAEAIDKECGGKFLPPI